ncbi:MAG: hypothetical protein VW230_00655 [Candidatus Poseidoniales archaeon]
MGLLDKVNESKETVQPAKKVFEPKTKEVAATPVAAPVAEVAPAPTKKEAKKQKASQPKARPKGLSSEFELASDMNRRINWLINFIVNFGFLIAGIVMNILTGGSSGIGIYTYLFGAAIIVLFLNIFVIPMKFSRNLGQFTSKTKYVKGDGSNPFFLHGILVNTVGIFSLIGFWLIITQVSQIGDDDNSNALIFTIVGTIFVLTWFINRYIRNGSELNQGMFDLMFGAYEVKFIPAETDKATGIFARLENMGSFGDKLIQRQEDKKQKKLEKASEDDPSEEENKE